MKRERVRVKERRKETAISLYYFNEDRYRFFTPQNQHDTQFSPPRAHTLNVSVLSNEWRRRRKKDEMKRS